MPDPNIPVAVAAMVTPHQWDGMFWTCSDCGEVWDDPCQCPCHDPLDKALAAHPLTKSLTPHQAAELAAHLAKAVR